MFYQVRVPEDPAARFPALPVLISVKSKDWLSDINYTYEV